MAYPTDNPMDGRGAPDEYDGGIYAEGLDVRVRPKRTPGGVTLGGFIARCDSPTQAEEIARRCQAHEGLLAAAKVGLRSLEAELMKIIDNRPHISNAALARLNADPIMVKLRADIAAARSAIATAEGR